MNWGRGIIISFIFFAVFIGMLVTVCVRQQISLVSKNYYSEELDYQQQIDQLNNAQALVVKPVVNVLRGHAVLEYNNLYMIQEGRLSLYRPSDPSLDKSFEVRHRNDPADSIITFDLSAVKPGKYNVIFSWKMNGKQYLSKQSVVL